jgi:hypothetical protein
MITLFNEKMALGTILITIFIVGSPTIGSLIQDWAPRGVRRPSTAKTKFGGATATRDRERTIIQISEAMVLT